MTTRNKRRGVRSVTGSGHAAAVESDLRHLLSGDVEFDEVSRALYATDAGLKQITPLGVVSPRDTDDVVRLVEYAAARGLALVPRGSGSGLAGGAVGEGIQIDFTRYMNRVLEIADDGAWARVQPGVIMGSLNRTLRGRGVFFAPDPSSENYCSLGGMIGTNSSGARTVAYGGTVDHVLALEAVLADGSILRPKTVSAGSADLSALARSHYAGDRALAQLLPVLETHGELIRTHMPNVVKNCSGYRVETVLSTDAVHPQRLFVGAEGTLGLVTEATLNLVPLPSCRGIAMVYFPSVFAAGEAVPGVLALRPTAVEIMDSSFLAVVRKSDTQIDSMLPAQTDTALLIEFEGADEGQLEDKLAVLAEHMGQTSMLQMVRPRDAEETDRLWTVRKSAVALALRLPGPRRALPFIEDVTVHPTKVADYVHFLQGLFEEAGVDSFMYGHVGDGNIHTRPLLDPKDARDLETMQQLYEQVSEYVLSVGGTMSGEHGDGLLRTPHIERMYGEQLYGLFEEIKGTFDPQGILNPGKKVGPQDDTGALRQALRYGASYHTLPQRTILHFEEGEYEREIEKCHGCSQCKGVVTGTMCPTYRATRREHASPRAKANMLRHVITAKLDPQDAYGSQALKTVSDYCILCGMCAVECPSNVNIPKLMLEAKSRYRAEHPGASAEAILSRAEAVSRLGSALAPVSNVALGSATIRRIMEPIVGIDRRRTLASYTRSTGLERPDSCLPSEVTTGSWGARAGSSGLVSGEAATRVDGTIPRLAAYFHDLYARFNDPHLGRLSLAVLRAHGLDTLVPPQRASGVPEMLYGYAEATRRIIIANLQHLAPLVERGAVLVGSEPTATFALKIHYPDYLPSAACSLVANAAHDLGEFLARYRADHPQASPVATALADRAAPLRVAYHLPCHLKAQQVGSPGLALLREIPGVETIDLAAGCCGMAGTFGMKKGTYDLSMEAGRPLFDRVTAAAPDIIASECSTCRLQLAQATGLETVHPIVLLAQAYGVRQESAERCGESRARRL